MAPTTTGINIFIFSPPNNKNSYFKDIKANNSKKMYHNWIFMSRKIPWTQYSY